MIKVSLNEMDTNNCQTEVVGFDKLLVEHAKKYDAKVIIRGFRLLQTLNMSFRWLE